ncbi:hypothetical protein R1flu_007716 [Riccia fluitans]|uniref:Uncharacterized protein n=1 Tax=Riccia fluitans TaxID=41844 RepID=A0ABD1Z2Q5_9MARC
MAGSGGKNAVRKSVAPSGSKSGSGSKKESIKPGDSAAKKASLKSRAPAVLLWPDGKPILGSDGKPIDPATLSVVVGKDGKSVVHGPDGKPFLLPDGKPLDPALVPPKAPTVMLWPDGKPILGSDGKPIDPSTLTVVVGADGKSVVHGPDGKPFLLPDGKPLDPALVPPKEPPPTPPKPYLGIPQPRFLRPPWEKPPRNQWPKPPAFMPYDHVLMKALKLEQPPQVEFQDGEWTRTMINLKKEYPKFVKVHLGPVEVNFEKHSGPIECFIQILKRDVPDYPELVGKPQFSACNFIIR